MPITNLASEVPIGSVICSRVEDIRNALETAEHTRPDRKKCPPVARGAILVRVAALVRDGIKSNTELLTLEQGKMLAESRSEWERAIETFKWHGEEAERLNPAMVATFAEYVPGCS